ncbi:MAG: glycosyltransferase [Phycisphaeraceae bacterium]|nr:glycosyltransferase [Phycisphaeraceae bacterium]
MSDAEATLETGLTPPDRWRVSDAPLRIALLGWARLGAQAREGSGYNLAASELGAGLALSGHRVFYLRSGMDYALRPGMFIRRIERWRGVECFHLYNSPNLAPALFNFRNMEREMGSPRQTRLVLGWLKSVGAEVVHAHSLEGFGLDVVGAIRDAGIPVIITPHNYWYACPQVDLLHLERYVCLDYEGGAKCQGCLKPALPHRTRIRRRIEQALHRGLGPGFGGQVRGLLFGRRRPRPGRGRAVVEVEELDPELGVGFEVSATRDHDGTVHNPTPLDADQEILEVGRSPLDQNERFTRADHHLTVLNTYGKRRRRGVDALNAASTVTPPSEFMRRAYEAMGVEPGRQHVLRLGLSHLDQINRRSRRSPFYRVRPWIPGEAKRPLRLAFFGTVRHNKGLDVLVRAILMLDTEVRQRCQFLIRAAGGDWLHKRRLGHLPEVSFLGGYDVRQLVSAGGEFDVGVLPHIWFENSPIVMLEFLHAGKFVISSRLGGPADWIVEPDSPGAGGGPGNGLLFPGGSPEGLAAQIARVVRGDVAVPSAEEVHEVSRLTSYPHHVAEAEALYRAAREGGQREARSHPETRVSEAKPAQRSAMPSRTA